MKPPWGLGPPPKEGLVPPPPKEGLGPPPPKEGFGPPPNVGALAAAACIALRSSSERRRPDLLFGFGGGCEGAVAAGGAGGATAPNFFSSFNLAFRRALFSRSLFWRSDWEVDAEELADEARELEGLKEVAVGLREAEGFAVIAAADWPKGEGLEEVGFEAKGEEEVMEEEEACILNGEAEAVAVAEEAGCPNGDTDVEAEEPWVVEAPKTGLEEKGEEEGSWVVLL